MNRKELLHRASAENLPLTESKLRRYINLGLIVSDVRGRGRARGTAAYYNERTVETLKEIHRLSSIKQEALIFTLFWKGYPVAWDKLKEALRVYVSTIDATFQDAVKAVSDPHNAEYAIQEIAKDALPPKRPGRPSKESEVELDLIYNRELQHAEGLLDFAMDIGTKRMLTVDNLISFFNVNKISIASDPQSIFSGISEWTNLDRMITSVLQADENEFKEMTEVIQTLGWYWKELKNTIGEPATNPYFKQLFNWIEEYYPGGFITENIALIQYILLALLAIIKQRIPIKEFLQSEHNKTTFSVMCQQLAANTIEGR